jgi:flagellar hook-basal body complex protein FliE
MANFGIEFGMKSVGGGLDTNSLRETRENLAPSREGKVEGGKDASFGDFLGNLFQEANQSQIVADQKLQEVAAGRNKDLHGAVLAMEKADVNFRLLTQVRNKVIEAYREIMRMQV